MQPESQGVELHLGAHLETEAAVWLLGSLAGLHGQPFDAQLVATQFVLPLDLPALTEALQARGLQAGWVGWPEGEDHALPLPAVAFLNAPEATAALTPALIIRQGPRTLTWVQPGRDRPETLGTDEARAQCAITAGDEFHSRSRLRHGGEPVRALHAHDPG